MPAQISVELNRPNLPAGGGMVFGQMDILPGDGAADSTRHVALCIDSSTSMEGDPIESAKQGASRVLGDLTDDDYLTIVTFDSDVEVVVEPVRFGQVDREEIFDKIDRIETASMTNISGGVERSRELLNRMSGTGVKRVVLLTDGKPNRGKTEISDLKQMARTTREGGASITAAGLGEDYNKEVVTSLAEASGGQWKHITDPDQIKQFFSDTVTSLETVTHTNPVVELSLDNIGIQRAFRRLPEVQEVSADWGSDSVRIDLPDLQAEQKQEILFKFEAPGGPEGRTQTLATASLQAGGELDSTTIDVTYSTDSAVLSQENESVRAKYVDAEARFQAGVKGDTYTASTIIDDNADTFTEDANKSILDKVETQIKNIENADTVAGARAGEDGVTNVGAGSDDDDNRLR